MFNRPTFWGHITNGLQPFWFFARMTQSDFVDDLLREKFHIFVCL